MMLRVDLNGNLPQAWSEYVKQNPGLSVISSKPLVLKLREPHADVGGVLSALGRLGVPARAVYLESRPDPRYALAAYQ